MKEKRRSQMDGQPSELVRQATVQLDLVSDTLPRPVLVDR